MTDTITDIKSLVDSFNAQRKELVVRLKGEFAGLFTEVFQRVPDLRAVTWTQYTPYFSDGDPCEFSRHDFYFVAKEYDEDGELVDLERYGEDNKLMPDFNEVVQWKSYLETDKVPEDFMKWYPTDEAMLKSYYRGTRKAVFESEVGKHFENVSYSDLTKKAEEAQLLNNLSDQLESIPEDMYKDLFGDHVSVVVTQEGVEVEEYDHD